VALAAKTLVCDEFQDTFLVLRLFSASAVASVVFGSLESVQPYEVGIQ
jgi:hypothetical protein